MLVEKSKDKLTCTLVLTLPEGTERFVVYCNASRVGMGGVLIHHGKIVAYACRAQGSWEELPDS